MLPLHEFLINFHFLRPIWFWGLIPIAIFLLWLPREKRNTGEWQRFIPAHLLKHLVSAQQNTSAKAALSLLALIWLLAILALAGPAWKKLPQPVFERIDAKVYVLDLSISMYAGDLTPSRLVRARLKLIDFLHSQREGLNALLVYAGDAHVVTPLSSDIQTITSLVPALEPAIMPERGSNAVAAVQKAIALLDNVQSEHGHILFFTDEIPDKQLKEIESLCTSSKYRVSILGIGTEAGAPIRLPDGQFMKDAQGRVILAKLNKRALQNLAATCGGRYSDIQVNDSDVDYLLSNTELIGEDNIRESERNFDVWQEAGYYLLFPILLLCLFAFRRGWILSVVFAVTLIYPHGELRAQANSTVEPSFIESSWHRLWLNGDQRGFKALQRRQYEQAAKSFTTPDWKASALYRQGQYPQAANTFTDIIKNNNFNSREEKESAWYNLGNARAKSGKLDEAISSYQQVLLLNSEHEDARFNMELLEKIRQEQDQQQKENTEDQQSESGESENHQQQEQQSGNDESTDQESSSKQNNSENEAENAQQSNAQEQIPETEQNSDPAESQQTEKQQSSNEESESMKDFNALNQEQQQALEQWLRQVPDDPSGLLRRKFQLEMERNRQNRYQQSPVESEQLW